MADVPQIEFIDPELIALDGGGNGLRPVAQLVHRGAVSLAASTGTDTVNIRMTLNLPGSFAWQLQTWQLNISGGDGDWINGRFEFFYAPSTTEFGQSTQLDYGLYHSVRQTIPESGVVNQNWNLGMGRGSTISFVELGRKEGPFDLLTFVDESTGPVIALSSGANADVAAADLRFNFTWLGYTFEQARSSLLHVGLHNRT